MVCHCSFSGYIRHTEIIACGHAPRCVHDLGGSRKKPLSKLPGSLAQRFIEFSGFQGSDRDTLTVYGIEAANRIAQHQETLWKSIHVLVASAHTRRKTSRLRFADRLRARNDVVNVGGRQRSCELNELSQVC